MFGCLYRDRFVAVLGYRRKRRLRCLFGGCRGHERRQSAEQLALERTDPDHGAQHNPRSALGRCGDLSAPCCCGCKLVLADSNSCASCIFLRLVRITRATAWRDPLPLYPSRICRQCHPPGGLGRCLPRVSFEIDHSVASICRVGCRSSLHVPFYETPRAANHQMASRCQWHPLSVFRGLRSNCHFQHHGALAQVGRT